MTSKERLAALATDDFQGRGNNYPRCGVPDTIDVREDTISCDFKNTSPKTAAAWLRRYLVNNGFTIKGEVDAFQSGDYEDDWVTATAKIQI